MRSAALAMHNGRGLAPNSNADPSRLLAGGGAARAALPRADVPQFSRPWRVLELQRPARDVDSLTVSKVRREFCAAAVVAVIALVAVIVARGGEATSHHGGEATAHHGPNGRTSQGEPITITMRGSRVGAFDTTVRVDCRGGLGTKRLHWSATVPEIDSAGHPTQTTSPSATAWQYTWRPALGPNETVVDRGAVPPMNDPDDLPAIPRPAATSIIMAERVGGEIRGTLIMSMFVQRSEHGFSHCEATRRFSATL